MNTGPSRAKARGPGVLVQQLVAALEAQKALGDYPSTLTRLLPFVDKSDPAAAARALASTAAKSAMTWFVTPRATLERRLEAPVCLRGDETLVFARESFYVDVLTHAPEGTDLVPPKAFLPAALQRFAAALAGQLRSLRDTGALQRIGSLQWRRLDHYFLLSRVRGGAIEATGAREPTRVPASAAAAPRAPGPAELEPSEAIPDAGDFAELFAATFDRLDHGDNWVRLVDLRDALPSFDRSTFDAGLAEIRRERLFGLEGAEGRHRTASEDELAAGIHEYGRVLLFVTRRDR